MFVRKRRCNAGMDFSLFVGLNRRLVCHTFHFVTHFLSVTKNIRLSKREKGQTINYSNLFENKQTFITVLMCDVVTFLVLEKIIL